MGKTHGVKVSATGTECRSAAEISRAEQAREAAERAQVEAARQAERAAREAKEEELRTSITQQVITERENQIAIAALMLALALLAFGGAGFLFARDLRNPAIGSASAGAILLLGAIVVFLTRPSFTEIDDRVAAALKSEDDKQQTALSIGQSGNYQCSLLPERSRITVSQENELPLQWEEGGCVNGRTQYGRDGAQWSRIFVPNEEQTVTISSYRPDRREFTTERFLLGLDTMTKAREIRAKYGNRACTTDEKALADIADMVKAIRAELPSQANERLVYKCERMAE